MDTKSFTKKSVEDKKEPEVDTKINELDNKLLSKDEEIKQLKARLQEAQKVNKLKKGDIRAEVNRQGDIKLICIGKNENGQKEWKKADELTEADIERRNEYIQAIKVQNAKKY
jgi:predicted RNase H-like nuclease (RuvC/YqgF family)